MPHNTHVSDHSYESRLFKLRVIVAVVIALLLTGVLLFRLTWLQVVDYSNFTDLSKNNRIRIMALPPNRGLIYDRNGVILAENIPTFHLEIIPEQVKDMNATLKGLGKIVSLSKSDIENFREQLRIKRPFQSISLRTRLSEEEVAHLAVNRFRFPGVDVTARLSRYYPQGKSASHVVGYVGRINEKDLRTIDVGNYRGSAYIGKSGLERYYEKQLHGRVGHQNVEVNAQGRILRVISKVPPIPGNDLILNLDIELQKQAEKALGNLAGSVIAIEPDTGAVVVFVSKPMFNPNLFVHGISHKDYNALQHGEDKPLFDRAIFGQYPPGSTIKPFIGLAGLEDKAIGYTDTIFCKGYYLLPGDKTKRKYRDWKKYGHGRVAMSDAIEQSCDVYFYTLAHRLGIDRIHDFLSKFGFGEKTGIDLYGERSGLLPSRAWKRRVHGKIWYPGETLIAGIGQGYVLVTPLQLASATATLASKGERFQPRLLHAIRVTGGNKITLVNSPHTYIKLHNKKNWNRIISAMERVVDGRLGTARATGWGMKFKMAGKTGTAQVFGIAQGKEYDKETVAKKLRDHGLFIGFGPVGHPVLAVAVVGEHGEHGSHMAPIARDLIKRYIEKYVTLHNAK